MQRTIILFVCAVIVVLISACSTASTETVASPMSPAASSSSPDISAASTTNSPPATVPATSSPTSETSISPSPAAPDSLVLWHSFPDGSPEQQTLVALLSPTGETQINSPVEVRFIPGDQILGRFEIEAAAGGGPDLFIAANDALLRQARAELLRNLDGDVGSHRANYAPNAVEGMTIDGKLYGVPLSRSTVALYYNHGTIASAPQTTQQFIDAAKSGVRIVLIRSAYHNFGFFAAFGGRLLDENGRCVADAGGVADALTFLRDLKAAGAQFVTDGAEAETRFKNGEADITINGSWLLGDFKAILGDQLGVTALPAGPAGPAKPLVGANGLFVNANSTQPADAAAIALHLTSVEAQTQWAERARQVPSNPSVAIADDAVGGLAAAALSGIAHTQQPELEAVWQPFDAALADVLESNADPVVAVQTACATVNAANGT